MDKGGTGYSWMVDDDFPSDITALEAVAELQDEKFQRTDTKDGIYNHHVVFMDLSSTQAPGLACEGKAAKTTAPSVFMAGATEIGGMRFAATQGNVKSGYYLKKDRKIVNIIDVINYNNVERTVYVSAEMEYIPGKAAGYLDSRQERVDPGLCGGPSGASIHPPKGVSKFSISSSNVIVARDGYIVNMRGHVHGKSFCCVITSTNHLIHPLRRWPERCPSSEWQRGLQLTSDLWWRRTHRQNSRGKAVGDHKYDILLH